MEYLLKAVKNKSKKKFSKLKCHPKTKVSKKALVWTQTRYYS